MTTATHKLNRLADDILRSLDQLDDADDPRVAAIRGHVLALASILTKGDTPAETPDAKEEREVRVRGFRPTTTPPLPPPKQPYIGAPSSLPEPKRSGATERRASRQMAGYTLKQVAQTAHVTLPTVRMYEARRISVRPDKRLALDSVYDQFKKAGDK